MWPELFISKMMFMKKILALGVALLVLMSATGTEAANYIGIKDGGRGDEFYNYHNWKSSNPEAWNKESDEKATHAWFRIPGKDKCVMFHNLPGSYWFEKNGEWHEWCWK